MSFAASAGRSRWIVDSVAIYVADHAVALQVAEAVKRNAEKAARIGVIQLDNGNKVARVRLEGRNAGPLNHHQGGAL
ncbi:MAG: hypothetical protein ACJ8G3_18305 [Burkholderiaceae bacterium]